MTTQTFVNLPSTDLARTTEFFRALGFGFDDRAADGRTVRMVVSDAASVLFHTEEYFREFTLAEVADPSKCREVALGLSADRREDVDATVRTVVAAGGTAVGEPVDLGYLYMRAWCDPDGHRWSVIWMDGAPG